MGTSVVRAQLAAGITVDSDLFTGITTATLTEAVWENDGYMRAVFDRDLTDAELAAVIRKMVLTEGVKTRIANKAVVQSMAPVERGVVNDVVRVEQGGIIVEEYVADEDGEWVETPSANVATAFSGQRVVIDLDGLRAYNAADQLVTTIMSANGRIVSSSALFASTDPASTAPGNVPALRVGAPAGRHLRLDGNDIVAMNSDSTQGEFFLNNGGLTRVFNLNILGTVFSPVRLNNALEGVGALTLRAMTGNVATGELQVRGGSNIRGKLANTVVDDGNGVAITFLAERVGVTTDNMNAGDFSLGNTRDFVSRRLTVFDGVFDNGQGGTDNAAAVFNPNGRLVRGGGSSRRVKYVDGNLDVATARKVLDLQAVKYRYISEVDELGKAAVTYPGFIAEDAHAAGLNLWVSYDMKGEPARIRYAELTAAHNVILRELTGNTSDLQTRLAKAEALLKKIGLAS